MSFHRIRTRTARSELLGILTGGPESYQLWATDYYELEIPAAAVKAMYGFQPITGELVSSLNPDASIADVIVSAGEIGYPVTNESA